MLTKKSTSIGIIGGSGALGSAIAKGLLSQGFVAEEKLWISNRSGSAADFGPEYKPRITTHNQELVDACDAIIVSVPPHLAPTILINASGHLVISVMAGLTIDQLERYTGAERVVRAMSSPAALLGLAYSPWCPNAGVSRADRVLVGGLFGAIGTTDEVSDEDQIDHFTAMTGPVPGFVAYFADCMVQYAVNSGIDQDIAIRAIRQLFLASGQVLADSSASPAEFVKTMIDYGGTTAAGLKAMQDSPLSGSIEEGLRAACIRAKQMC